MYFRKFPLTYYTLNDQQTTQLVRNILIRFVVKNDVKNNLLYYQEYDIKDGETPEIVSFKFYNNTEFHWVILHTNEILDPRFEWILAYNDLVKFCEGKYTNIYGIHHYENAAGYVVNSTATGAVPVTNIQHEVVLNEAKRRIKIIKPEFLEDIIREFENRVELAYAG